MARLALRNTPRADVAALGAAEADVRIDGERALVRALDCVEWTELPAGRVKALHASARHIDRPAFADDRLHEDFVIFVAFLCLLPPYAPIFLNSRATFPDIRFLRNAAAFECRPKQKRSRMPRGTRDLGSEAARRSVDYFWASAVTSRPAMCPKTRRSVSALRPRRLPPWMPPVISPAA